MEQIIEIFVNHWRLWIEGGLFAERFFQYWHLWIVGALLAGIAIRFFWRFVVPTYRLDKNLRNTIAAIDSVKARGSDHKVVELDEIKKAMGIPALAHIWSEYAETLHPQRETDETGQRRIVRWRATALAETFFTEQVLVDTPLETEYYKHLPGILTGLGIIGTFSGLIMGLSNFDVSDPAQAQIELKNLINSVGHAFYVSAAAIALAMLFTWIEKSRITALYRRVEEMAQLVDSLFDAGAGEEYLERLVVASENQASQAMQIKDALVADLKEILTTLTAQQISTQGRHTELLSTSIGKTIADHLGGPISDIAVSVKGVSTSQREAVNKMLTDVLADFSGRLEGMFGGQMHGMTEILKETSEAMRTTAGIFARLASDMDAAGKHAADAMGERLNQAVSSMEMRQQAMNEQMGTFVRQIQALVAESQTESARKLKETLGTVGDQVALAVAELRRQSEESTEAQGQRQERFAENTEKAVALLSSHMEGLLIQSVETNRALENSVLGLSQATNKAIADMNSGAETLFVAASDFAKAGQGVAETMRASSDAVGNLKVASNAFATATSATQEMIADYRHTHDSFATMVTEFKSVSENARRDAAMTSEIITRIEAAAKELGTAQLKAQGYLEGVNKVLTEAHESFSENVSRTLQENNRQFHKELGNAVNAVSVAVRDLGDTLDNLSGRGR
ncbi:MAG: anti-phage defense ZorAB system ZorA [Magnetococcales bacterium]|nr:anti-phage defense ZorAB system ZorA [Magnetococcales bacterium]